MDGVATIERVQVIHADCREAVKALPDCSIDAVCTDPPYALVSIVKRFGKPGSAAAKSEGATGVYQRASSGFMGQQWDTGEVAFDPEFWAEVLRVLKPGGYVVAFGGTRTYHRLACAIEDAGFEIRDMIAWVYGSGFPKSMDVSKAIDKRGGASVAWFGPWFRKWREENGVTQKQVAALFPSKSGRLTGCVANWELGLNMPTPEQFNLIRDTFGLPFASVEEAEREVVGKKDGNLLAVAPGQDNDRSATTLDITAPATEAARQWQGWGTALKPALEPITVARKPLTGTVAENVLAHGTGALNIDACRIDTNGEANPSIERRKGSINHLSDRPARDTEAEGRMASRQSPEAFRAERPGEALGRWPANVIHDGSEEVLEAFAAYGEGKGAAAPVTKRNADKFRGTYGAFKGNADEAGSTFRGDTGTAARFFQSCPWTELDEWKRDPASSAAEVSNLQSEAAVSALSHAVARSMPGSALLRTSYRAPSISVTGSEFEIFCEIVTETIRSFARRCSRGSPPQSITVSDSHASCVATLGQTDTITITASLSKSNGSADPVTFSITRQSGELGERGSASALRFHYSSKADADDRWGSRHPTIKPLALIRWLCRLITPPGGVVLDPFAGSGTTAVACLAEGFRNISIEREDAYVKDIRERVAFYSGEGRHSVVSKNRNKAKADEPGPLFGGAG